MTKFAEELRSQLEQLSAQDRAEIASFLIQSLDNDSQAEIDDAWREELDHRWQQIQDGEDVGIPWEEVRADLRKRFP